MIHEHLIMSGCFKTAETLRKEIEITPLVDPGQFRSTSFNYPRQVKITLELIKDLHIPML